MIKKFDNRILEPFIQTECTVNINREGVSEQGEPLKDLVIKTKCRFVEKLKKFYTKEGQEVKLLGRITTLGDIAPNVKISGGTVEVEGDKYYIYEARRGRNPDGSIHHTVLELM